MTQTMNPTAAQNSTTTFTRTVPQPTVAAPSNPLEETLANVAAMREALDSLNSRLLEAAASSRPLSSSRSRRNASTPRQTASWSASVSPSSTINPTLMKPDLS